MSIIMRRRRRAVRVDSQAVMRMDMDSKGKGKEDVVRIECGRQ